MFRPIILISALTVLFGMLDVQGDGTIAKTDLWDALLEVGTAQYTNTDAPV